MFAAFMAAKPLIKFGVPALIIVLLFGAYKVWEYKQEQEGYKRAEAVQQAGLTVQTQEAMVQKGVQEQNSQEKIEGLTSINQQLVDQLNAMQKRIDDYEKQVKQIPIDAVAVRMVDDMARVLNSSPTSKRAAATDGATEEPVVATSTETRCTVGDLLERNKFLTELLAMKDAAHMQLSAWAIDKYEHEVEFYNSAQGEVSP